MPQLDSKSPRVARRRGRPVGSDSAETRNRILRAARQVINERGYHAATFQAIAIAADLSRPTLHYYFTSREEIYEALVAEAGGVMADCIGAAKRQRTTIDQLAALLAAIHEADLRDRSQIAFLVSARLEATRNPDLPIGVGGALRGFLESLVVDAKARGELSPDTAITPITDMLDALLWGLGFHAGFVNDRANMILITKQLGHLLSHGLLEDRSRRPNPADTMCDTPSAVGSRP
jgi:AcrR family transcriptional regulator